MPSMEEIHLRVDNDVRRSVARALTHDLNKTGSIEGLEEIRVYLDAVIDTDLCIQLYWNIPVSGQGSDISHTIINGMHATGSIKHTVWHEYMAH